MSDIIATIDQNQLTASVGFTTGVVSLTNLVNPTTVTSLSDIGNTNTTNLQNGSILVFNTETNKWIATIHLNNQDVEAGEF